MFIAQLLHNSYTTLNFYFYFKSTIEYLWLICRKTNPMIDYKNKKNKKKIKKLVRVVYELYNNH
jgi:hypothetical protein